MTSNMDWNTGDLVWFDPGIGHWLPGEVLECHRTANVLTLQAHINGKPQSFALTDGEGQVRRRQDLGSGGVEDMCQLSDLHEAALLWNLKLRYDRNLIYTYAGSILIAVNPYRMFDTSYGIESAQKYKGKLLGALPPHLFALGATAHAALPAPQVVVISGESGSGKTESTKLVMQYLAAVAPSAPRGQALVTEQILEAAPLLEAFGNARTTKNDNSSRFGKYLEVFFKHGAIVGAKITQYLLEKSRIVTQAPGERNYHVFYELLGSLNPAERQKYGLVDADKYFYLNQGGGDCSPGHSGSGADWGALRGAMQILGVGEAEQEGIIKVLASVLHLGNVYFHRRQLRHGQEGVEIGSEAEIKWAAHLLQISSSGLQRALTSRITEARAEKVLTPLGIDQALDARDAFAKALYSALFNWLVSKVNSIVQRGGLHDAARISLLDIFGFEDLAENSFEQLCINFASESLQLYFNKHIFKLEQQEYAKERLEWTNLNWSDNTPVIHLLGKKPVGILHLLDDESNFPRASDASFLEKCHYNHALNENYCRPRVGGREFGIKHYAGQVWYSVDGFLDKNRDALRPDIVELLASSREPLVCAIAKPLLNQIQARTLPRGANGRFVTMKPRTPTVAARFSDSLQQLLDSMSRCTPWFVRCIKPNNDKTPMRFDMPVVLQQLRYLGLLDTIHIRQAGYPIRLKFQNFVEQYRYLLPGVLPRGAPYRDLCRAILDRMPPTSTEGPDYQLGATRVFLRESLQRQLETTKHDILRNSTLIIQKNIRGYLARKKFQSLKKSTILIQSIWRGYREKNRYKKLLHGVIKAQALFRGKRERKKFSARKREYKRMKIVKENAEKQRISRENKNTINHLEIPAELAFIFTKLESYSPVTSERNLVKVLGGITGAPASINLPPDLDQFGNFSSVYFKNFGMKREPISAPFLSKAAARDQDFQDAVAIFKLVLRWGNDAQMTGSRERALADYIVYKGLSSRGLRDELLVQLCNQSWKNDNSDRIWQLMAHCLSCFQPSPALNKYLLKHITEHASQGYKTNLQRKILRGLKRNPHTRTYPPSLLEWRSNKQKSEMALPLTLSDGTVTTISVDSWTTCEEAAAIAVSPLGVSPEGWSVILDDCGALSDGNGLDFVLDLVSELELCPAFPVTKSDLLKTGSKKEIEHISPVRPQVPPPEPPRKISREYSPTRKISHDALSRNSALNERYFEVEKVRSRSLDNLLSSDQPTDLVNLGLSQSRLNDRYHSVEQLAPIEPIISNSKQEIEFEYPDVSSISTKGQSRYIKSSYVGKKAPAGSHSSRAHIEKSEFGVRSSAMSDTSEAPSLASHVRRVRVPSQASDVDQFLDELFSPVLDGNLDELSDARSLAASIKGGRQYLNQNLPENHIFADNINNLIARNIKFTLKTQETESFNTNKQLIETIEGGETAQHPDAVISGYKQAIDSRVPVCNNLNLPLNFTIYQQNLPKNIQFRQQLLAQNQTSQSLMSQEANIDVKTINCDESSDVRFLGEKTQFFDEILPENNIFTDDIDSLVAKIKGGSNKTIKSTGKVEKITQETENWKTDKQLVETIEGSETAQQLDVVTSGCKQAIDDCVPVYNNMNLAPNLTVCQQDLTVNQPNLQRAFLQSEMLKNTQFQQQLFAQNEVLQTLISKQANINVKTINFDELSYEKEKIQFLDEILPENDIFTENINSLVAKIKGGGNRNLSSSRSSSVLDKEVENITQETEGSNSSVDDYISDLFRPIFINDSIKILTEKHTLVETIKGGGTTHQPGASTSGYNLISPQPIDGFVPVYNNFNLPPGTDLTAYQQNLQRAFLQSAMAQNIQIQQQLLAQNQALQTLLSQQVVEETSKKSISPALSVKNRKASTESNISRNGIPIPPPPPPLPPPVDPSDPSEARPFMDPYGRAKTVRIGKWRWPPPKDSNNQENSENFIHFKMRQQNRKITPTTDWEEVDFDKEPEKVTKNPKRSFEVGANRPSPGSVGKLKLSSEMRQRLEQVTSNHSVRSSSSKIDSPVVNKLEDTRKLMLEQQLTGRWDSLNNSPSPENRVKTNSPTNQSWSSNNWRPIPPPPPIGPLPPAPNVPAPPPPIRPPPTDSFLAQRQDRDTFGIPQNSKRNSFSANWDVQSSLTQETNEPNNWGKDEGGREGENWEINEGSDLPARNLAVTSDERWEMESKSYVDKARHQPSAERPTFRTHQMNRIAQEREKKHSVSTITTDKGDKSDEWPEFMRPVVTPPPAPKSPVPTAAKLLPLGAVPCLTYNRVSWTLRARKEVFSPAETLGPPSAIHLMFCQIVSDVYGITPCLRLNQSERRAGVNMLSGYGITAENIAGPHRAHIKRQVVELARTWPLYFSRLFPVSGATQLSDVQILAVSHWGVHLVKRDSSLKVIASISLGDISSCTAPRPSTVVLEGPQGRLTLHTPRAMQVSDMVMKFLAENRKIQVKATPSKPISMATPVASPTATVTVSDRHATIPEKMIDLLPNSSSPAPLEVKLKGERPSSPVGARSPSPGSPVPPSGKYSMLQFALNHFRKNPELEVLKMDSSLKSKEKRKEWTWKQQTDLVKWQGVPLDGPLLRLEDPELAPLAMECFECILKYCGDLPLDAEMSEVKCVYTVLMHCHKHPQLRDEIYCQLLKQTTSNKSPSPESSQRAWRLLSIIAAYFSCSETLKPFLTEHLSSAASDRRRICHGTASVCLANLRKTQRCGGRKNVPSVEEVTAVSAGRSARRQIYRLPGGAERVVNTRCSTVVGDVIGELCEIIGVNSEAEQQEFSLYCIVQGDAFTMPLAADEYILDVTTELHKAAQPFYLIFCRSVWYHPLKLDATPLYTEVLFNQVAPDYLEGLLLKLTPSIPPSTVRDISLIAALLHRAADLSYVPTLKEVKFLLPKPILSIREPRPPQWLALVQTAWGQAASLQISRAKHRVLQVLSTWPLFGSSFFAVKRVLGEIDSWQEHILALNRNGVHFLDLTSHETLQHWPFAEVISTRKVRSEDGALFLDMKCGNLLQQRVTRLQTEQAHEISRLVRQYITLEQANINRNPNQ